MITILTRALLPWKMREIRYAAISALNRFRGLPPKRIPVYGGHVAITRSICEGFGKLDIPFNHDPRRFSEVGSTVACICDPRTLAQAIKWKRQGRIHRLYAGYTIVNSPLEQNGLALAPELDGYICFSQWHLDSFDLQAPGFRKKGVVCPFGVDEDYWTPAPPVREEKRLLFYKKRAPHALYHECLRLAHDLGFEVEEIVYGAYKLPDYLRALRRSALVVNWVDHETQGISLAEAWAADVPTLVWNPGFVFHLLNSKGCVFECSSAPYLTDETGRFFRDAEGLASLLESCLEGRLHFAPRHWVLENMTDTICARRLHDILAGRALPAPAPLTVRP